MTQAVGRLHAEVISELSDLERLAEAWDELAVAASRPLAAPGWLLAWWRHMAPRSARLRAVAVREAGELVGFAPYFVVRVRGAAVYRPLGGESMAVRTTPLARRGLERETANAMLAALRRASPQPALLELSQVDVESIWPRLLTEEWPSHFGARRVKTGAAPAPCLYLHGRTFDAWLGDRSSKFRSNIRRYRRKLDAMGATTRLVRTDADLTDALAAYDRLHGARFGDTTPLATSAGRAMLLDAGRALLTSERFRAYVIETEESVVTVQLFIAAGDEVAYFSGGWNRDYFALSPALVGVCAAIEDACARGERKIDLGEGAQPYKLQLTEENEPIAWYRIYPIGARLPYALLAIEAPPRARTAAGKLTARARTLPPVARLRAADLPPSRDREPDVTG